MRKKIKQKIKKLPFFDRPREKLFRYGVSRLKDEELLAIIFSVGKKNDDVLSLAQKVLHKIPEEKLQNLSLNNLKELDWLGKVKQCQLLALVELGRRWFGEKKKKLILQPKDIWEELRDYRDKKKEYFFVYYLDSRNSEIKKELISIGTLNQSIAHPREIFEPALRYLAAQIVLVHNHPSGDVEPSEEDLALTKKLIAASELLGIEIIDHVIIAKDGYFSFAENKLIKI